MELFSFFRSKANRQFVTGTDLANDHHTHLKVAIQTIGKLRELNVEEEHERKLSYRFYTDTLEKSTRLVEEIKKLNHTVLSAVPDTTRKLYVVSGWTNELKTSYEIIENMTKKMYELGNENDCEFEGWNIA